MEKTILIAGKDLPDSLDLADGILMSGRNVVATTSKSSVIKNSIDGEVVPILWNKMSPVSAQSVILDCENKFRRLDEAILVFDELLFAEKFDGLSLENSSKGIDEMILGYQYLTQELLSKYEKRYNLGYSNYDQIKPAKLVMYYKSSPSEIDVLKTNSLRNTISCAAGPIVSAASSAFVSFAENIAAVFGSRDFVNIVLVKGDYSNEICKNERSFATWICNYMDEVDLLKTKLTSKQSSAWVKVGSKGPSSGFGFLR